MGLKKSFKSPRWDLDPDRQKGAASGGGFNTQKPSRRSIIKSPRWDLRTCRHLTSQSPNPEVMIRQSKYCDDPTGQTTLSLRHTPFTHPAPQFTVKSHRGDLCPKHRQNSENRISATSPPGGTWAPIKSPRWDLASFHTPNLSLPSSSDSRRAENVEKEKFSE